MVVAGGHDYPRLLVEGARRAGVEHIEAIAFKGETNKKINTLVDRLHHVPLGQLETLLGILESSGIADVMLAGQIAPRNVFNLRLDQRAKALYGALKVRTAQTIFGALVDEIEALGLQVLPGNTFMDSHMPQTGLLSSRTPTEREQADIEIGLQLVRNTNGYEIGQTVAVKEGFIVAVEALEGTNQTIRRAGKIGQAGTVIVKVPRRGHDMRFDIPVVGAKTFQVMKKARVSCLAVEANGVLLFETEKLIRLADRYNIAFTAVEEAPA